MWKAGAGGARKRRRKAKDLGTFFGLVFPFCHSERPLDRGEEQDSRGRAGER